MYVRVTVLTRGLARRWRSSALVLLAGSILLGSSLTAAACASLPASLASPASSSSSPTSAAANASLASASPVPASAAAAPASAATAPTPATGASALPGLRVDGPRLLLDGRPVILRGVAMGDPISARRLPGAVRPLADYAVVHDAWHANVVRLSVHPTEWIHQQADVLAALDADVGAALSQGMCVIIDWHSIGWPDGVYQVPDPSWGAPPDQYDSSFALATSFWDTIARRYADRPRVAFELWNEPMADADRTGPWQPQWTDLKPYWERLLATVRASAGNLVIVTSNCWSYDLRGVREDPLAGDNIAYAWHVYSGHDDNDPARWAEKLDDLQTVAPVFVTEWAFEPFAGAQYPGTAKSFGYPWVKRFLDGRRLDSTAWVWDPDWTPALLQKDWSTPTEYGFYVRRYLWHRPPRVVAEAAAGVKGGSARVHLRVDDAGPEVRLWLRIDGGPVRSLGWRAANRDLALTVSCDLSRGAHTYHVRAENLIARQATGAAALVVR